MKSIPAIIASDIAQHAAAVDKAMQRLREAQQHEEAVEERAHTARQVTARARLELGRALAAARKQWPLSGPNAKGWTDFLAVHRIAVDFANDAMKYAGFVEKSFPGASENAPGELQLPSMREAGIDNRPRDGERDPGPTNVHGGTGEKARGAYCTPLKYAMAVGTWDLDPFSNPRAHIVAEHRCMLEDGGNGLADPAHPGCWTVGGEPAVHGIADGDTRVFIQPDYRVVEEAIEHYGHTRFCALLRFAPDTGWFAAMWPHVEAIAIPRERISFEAPDGIEADGAPFPHVFFYADERDITDEIRRLCIVLRVEHNANERTNS